MQFSLYAPLTEHSDEETHFIAVNSLNDGWNFLEHFMVNRHADGTYTIYDRVCDHSGGKLITQPGSNTAYCPLHGWRFDPDTGHYENAQVCKKTLPYRLNHDNIEVPRNMKTPIIPKLGGAEDVEIRFINHAFLIVKTKHFQFATDPWALGPAFTSGWWLKHASPSDWQEELRKCDFIYISHNHPDHLHPLTLSHIDPDTPIIAPEFQTDSTGLMLESIGLNNVFRATFGSVYRANGTPFCFTVLKSGDFREDSTILFSIGDFTAFFTVDSNMPNFGNYPKDITLLATSFAAGASGYPVCFDNIPAENKKKIVSRNRNALKAHALKAVINTVTPYYMPYAGFFTERAERDAEIQTINQKNSVKDLCDVIGEHEVKVLNVEEFDTYHFKGTQLTHKINSRTGDYIDHQPSHYIEGIRKEYGRSDSEFCASYFKASEFSDMLILTISLTSDSFDIVSDSFEVDFSGKIPSFSITPSVNNLKDLKPIPGIRRLFLRIRQESFYYVIKNHLPWEDLSIGFQCRIDRDPDIYNSSFWHHFTNIYVADKVRTAIAQCNRCERGLQLINSIAEL